MHFWFGFGQQNAQFLMNQRLLKFLRKDGFTQLKNFCKDMIIVFEFNYYLGVNPFKNST